MTPASCPAGGGFLGGSLVAAEGVSPSGLPRQGGLFFEELREVASQHSEPVKEDARLMAKSA